MVAGLFSHLKSLRKKLLLIPRRPILRLVKILTVKGLPMTMVSLRMLIPPRSPRGLTVRPFLRLKAFTDMAE